MKQVLPSYARKERRIKMNGIFYAAISSSSFGFSPLFSIGMLAAGLTNFDVLSYRWAIAALVLIVYALCKKKSLKFNSPAEFWKILLLSLLRSITSVTLLIGYSNIASGVATTINFMYPVIVTLTMMIFFGEDKSWINILAIALSIAGLCIMSFGDWLDVEGGNTTLGFICSLISSFSFAAYYVFMKILKADKIEVVKFTTWVMTFSAIYFIVGALLFNGKVTMITDWKTLLYALGLGLWATMISNFTGVKAVRRIGPTLTSILGALQPVTALLLGILFLDEHLGPKIGVGMALIMAGVSIVVTHQKKASKQVRTESSSEDSKEVL